MDYCDRGIQETKHKRHGSSRRGGTPDRRYSSSSDEGTKISGNRDCRNRVRNLGQQGMASTGTEGWRAYDGGNGQIVQALPGRNPSSGSKVLSDTLNSSMQQRLYSYFSGSEDEEENGYAPHRLQNKWPRRSPSPVDVSSPSWVRSPSDLSCESETEQRPPSPRFDRRADGTRFGENIYSRINSDAGKFIFFNIFIVLFLKFKNIFNCMAVCTCCLYGVNMVRCRNWCWMLRILLLKLMTFITLESEMRMKYLYILNHLAQTPIIIIIFFLNVHFFLAQLGT